MTSSIPNASKPLKPRIPALILLGITAVLAFLTLIMPVSTRPLSQPLEVGLVASQDVQAPRDIEYVSQVLTEQMRDSAERAVEPVYSLPDPSIARQQLERLRTTLDYITLVRNDPALTIEQKQANIIERGGVVFSSENLQVLYTLSDARWEAVQADSLRVLEQLMRTPVRQNDLDTLKVGVSSYTSLDLTDTQAGLAADLIIAYLVPNSFYSADLTLAAQQAARDAVQPVTRSFLAGETVIQRGKVLTESDVEALQQLGLIDTGLRLYDYLGAGAVVGILTLLILLYVVRRNISSLHDFRNQFLIAFFFLIFLVVARLVIPNRTVVPYLFPVPAFAMLTSALFGVDAGILLSLALSTLTAYGLPNSLDLSLYYLLMSWCGLLVLGPARRLGVFFRAGTAAGLAGTVIIAAYRIPFTNLDWLGIVMLVSAAFVNGLASAAITLLLQAFFAQQLGLATALQLLDISRPDFPLLQFFLRNAPGTYQHSLQVANLAEQAGEAIGADTLLIRVGALYHDCGKSLNPTFFIENQIAGQLNPHDDIPPEEAAAQVIRHVPDGVQLARKHHLPRRIDDFILEHHGTLTARYHYNRAIEQAGSDKSKVDSAKFRYPGPSPRSRETALMMLADGVEARARAERPKDEAELRAIIKRVIEFCQQDGQLDSTKLTLRDLHLITEAFVTALRGVYHPRIQYPEQKSAGEIPVAPVKKEKL